jgi:hypothetical protein
VKNVSLWAEPFCEPDEDDEPTPPERNRGRARNGNEAFLATINRMQGEARERSREQGKRALRWAAYAIVSFILATHVLHGGWSFAAWCSTMIWGLGAWLQLEAANTSRLESTLSPF